MSGKENDFKSIANEITKAVIGANGVQSLADRPNLTGQYGTAGLSGTALKLHFDKLATAIADRVNDIIKNLGSTDAGKCIRVNLDDVKIYTLNGLVESFNDGTFAKDVLQLKADQFATDNTSLQTIINGIASTIASQAELIETANTNIASQGAKITTIGGVVDGLSTKWTAMEADIKAEIKNIAEKFAITPDDIEKLLTDEKIASVVKTYVKLDDITGVDGSLTVTKEEKKTWNEKADASTIPLNVSQLNNDRNYVTADDIKLSNLGALPADVTINGVGTSTDENGDKTTSFTLTLEHFDPVTTNDTSTDTNAADNIRTALENALNASTTANTANVNANTANQTATEAKDAAAAAAKDAKDAIAAAEAAKGGATENKIEAEIEVGYITKGTEIPEKTTLEEFIKMLVYPDLAPITTYPYISSVVIKNDGVPVNQSYEVGTVLNNLTVTVTYEDGTYSYADNTTATTDTNATVSKWYITVGETEYSIDETSATAKDITYNLGSLTIADGTSYSVSAKADYSDGTTPTTSKDKKPYDKGQIKAGTTQLKTSSTITGYRAWFAGVSTTKYKKGEDGNFTSDVDSAVMDSAVIRGLEKKGKFSGETLTLEYSTDAKSFIVAVLKDEVKSFTAKNALNMDETYSKGSVKVADVNGGNETEYDVWVYSPDKLSDRAIHNITIK